MYDLLSARKTNVRVNAGMRLAALIFVIFIMTAPAEASDSLYLEYIQKSDSMFVAGQYDSSLSIALQAKDEAMARYGREDTLVARALFRMGECHYRLADFTPAESCWTAALTIREKVRGPDHIECAECLYGLADIAYNRDQYQRSESLYLRAADIWEQLRGEERHQLVRALVGIGNSIYMRGQFPQAADQYYRALNVAREALGKEHETSLWLMSNISLVLIRIGKNDEALDLLQKTTALVEEKCGPQSPFLYRTLNSIGLIYRRFAEHEKAASYFKRMVNIIEDSLGRDDSLLAIPLLNLGKIYRNVGDLPQAERYLLRHLDIMNKWWADKELEMAATITVLASIYYDRGDSAAFQRYYHRALSIYEQSLNSGFLELPGGLIDFGYYFHLYDTKTSLEFARHSFELRRNYLLSNYLSLSEADALHYSWFMREAASYYLSFYLEINPVDSADLTAAADIIFASKGQVSDEMYERNMALSEETSPGVIAMRDSLGQAKIGLSAAYVSGADSDDLDGYERRRDSLVKEINRLETKLIDYGVGKPRFREPRYVSAARVAENLPPRSVLIEYLRYSYVQRKPDTITERYLVTVLRPKAVNPFIVDVGSADEIGKLVSDYQLHMNAVSAGSMSASGLDQEYSELASRIFNKIWKPIEGEISDCDLLLIAPDGALNLISFAGLPDEKGRYLAEKYAVHYLSSGRDAIWLNGPSPTGAGLFALGDPDYDASARIRKSSERTYPGPGNTAGSVRSSGRMDILRNVRSDCLRLTDSHVTRLPATRNEIDRIVSLWNRDYPDTARSFLDKEATEDNLKKHAPGNRVIHIATHGFYCPASAGGEQYSALRGEYTGHIDDNPLLQSGLFLAGSNLHGDMADSLGIDDGILTAEEVSIMDLTGVEWVVLSACESGLGEVETGEGVYGLRRAFQMAGARTVISSLWPVADKSTAEFMISLYGATDLPLYEKMHRYQKSQIEKLRKYGYSDHPYYWGAFIASGDWR